MEPVQQDRDRACAIIDGLIAAGPNAAKADLGVLIRRHRRSDKTMWTKADLVRQLERSYKDDTNYSWVKKVLTKAPIRSLSGITSVTVLTKPFPCPGRCVFCPVDVRMPKSYIATEPGAMRAGSLGFDPYQQVASRLRAYADMGHPTSKIELIVLGGTWSSYPAEYQRWFVKRLFDALNDFGNDSEHDAQASHAYPTDWQARIDKGETYNSHINASQYMTNAYEESATWEELWNAHAMNETAAARCVGMSLETRPDLVDVDECISLRSLGATKIQIGIQSLDDKVLRLNKRGHKVAKTEEALQLLRRFGFKIHAHWMPNLYGSTPDSDIVDYDRVFTNLSVRPDELKVYPTALIQDTELERIAARGDWRAYDEEDLNRVLAHVLTHTPEYCRLTRIIRDIPSHEILEGNKKGNLRQIVERSIEPAAMRDIRAREIKNEDVSERDLVLEPLRYETAGSVEFFLQFVRPSDRKLAAFLRLSLPHEPGPIDELGTAAIIREVHVYGQSISVGDQQEAAQHRGLGKQLIAEACGIARAQGRDEMAVISAVGTRPYYAKLGFSQRALYQYKEL